MLLYKNKPLDVTVFTEKCIPSEGIYLKLAWVGC